MLQRSFSFSLSPPAHRNLHLQGGLHALPALGRLVPLPGGQRAWRQAGGHPAPSAGRPQAQPLRGHGLSGDPALPDTQPGFSCGAGRHPGSRGEDEHEYSFLLVYIFIWFYSRAYGEDESCRWCFVLLRYSTCNIYLHHFVFPLFTGVNGLKINLCASCFNVLIWTIVLAPRQPPFAQPCGRVSSAATDLFPFEPQNTARTSLTLSLLFVVLTFPSPCLLFRLTIRPTCYASVCGPAQTGRSQAQRCPSATSIKERRRGRERFHRLPRPLKVNMIELTVAPFARLCSLRHNAGQLFYNGFPKRPCRLKRTIMANLYDIDFSLLFFLHRGQVQQDIEVPA